MDDELRQAHGQAALALLTAWLDDEDGTSEFPAALTSDLVVELGQGNDLQSALRGALSLVAGLTSVGGHLLIRASRANGTSEEEELQSVSLLYT
jgi:hypothetical protein